MIKLITFITVIFFSNASLSANLAVIDIEYIIDTNKQYKDIIEEIDIDQNKNTIFLQEIESKLDKLFDEIENSKLLLDQNELNKLINKYNKELNHFNDMVEKINIHYQQQIANIRKVILQEIIVLAEKYAKDNNIDIILDSTSYIIASNKLNITNLLKEEIGNIKLNLEFVNFEKN